MIPTRHNNELQGNYALTDNTPLLNAPIFLHGVRATRYKKNREGSSASRNQSELKFLNALISFTPNKSNVYVNRGVTYLQMGEVQKAIRDFTTALQLSTTSSMAAVAYSNRGTAFNFIDRFSESIKDFDLAIELDSQLWHPFLGRGIAFMHLRSYQKAINDFNECIRINPNNPVCFLERAKTSYHFAKHDESLADCNSALKIQPGLVEAYGIRAAINLLSGKYEEALLDLTKAIELDKNYAPAYLVRSNILRALGSEHWKADRQKALELDNNLDFSP